MGRSKGVSSDLEDALSNEALDGQCNHLGSISSCFACITQHENADHQRLAAIRVA